MTPQGMDALPKWNPSHLVQGPSPAGRAAWDSSHLQTPYAQSPPQGFGQMPPGAGGYARGQAAPGMYQPASAYGNGYPPYQS